MDEFPLSEYDPVRYMEENSQEDCLPFFLDDESSGPEGSSSFLRRRSSMKSTYGFSPDKKVGRTEAASTTSNNVNLTSRYGITTDKLENTSSRLDRHRPTNRLSDPLTSMDQRPPNTPSGGTKNLNMFFPSHFSLWFL